jgi:hypothetical protein
MCTADNDRMRFGPDDPTPILPSMRKAWEADQARYKEQEASRTRTIIKREGGVGESSQRGRFRSADITERARADLIIPLTALGHETSTLPGGRFAPPLPLEPLPRIGDGTGGRGGGRIPGDNSYDSFPEAK